MALEVKTAKNSKLPKLSENCFEPVGKGGWPPISIWIVITEISSAQGDKNSASSTQDWSHSWHKINPQH
jgi:hypothetical protein